MGIETKIKSLGVPQTKIWNFHFRLAAILKNGLKGQSVPVFFLATSRISVLGVHRRKWYHSWRIMRTPVGLWTTRLTTLCSVLRILEIRIVVCSSCVTNSLCKSITFWDASLWEIFPYDYECIAHIDKLWRHNYNWSSDFLVARHTLELGVV